MIIKRGYKKIKDEKLICFWSDKNYRKRRKKRKDLRKWKIKGVCWNFVLNKYFSEGRLKINKRVEDHKAVIVITTVNIFENTEFIKSA